MDTGSFTFKGTSFQFVKNEVHASWWSFQDESQVREDLWNTDSGDLVLDIGCAYGPYSLCSLSKGASNIRAWSPNQDETSIFQKSLELNQWKDKCIIYDVGLYSNIGWLEAYSQTFSKKPFDKLLHQQRHHIFQVRTLDSYLDSLPTNLRTWIKIDVEGAEVEVLKGGIKTLQSLLPHVFVENHEFKDPGIGNRVQKLMSDFGWNHVETRPYHGVTHSLYTPPI